MSNVFKGIDQQKKRIKIPKSTNSLTDLLLIYLVENNPLTRTRPIRKIEIIKEVSSIKDKNKVITMTLLFLRRKKKIFHRLNTSTAKKKAIT